MAQGSSKQSLHVQHAPRRPSTAAVPVVRLVREEEPRRTLWLSGQLVQPSLQTPGSET